MSNDSRSCDNCKESYPTTSPHWTAGGNGEMTCSLLRHIPEAANDYKCQRCRTIGKMRVTKSGPHLKLACAKCSSFITFLPRDGGPSKFFEALNEW